MAGLDTRRLFEIGIEAALNDAEAVENLIDDLLLEKLADQNVELVVMREIAVGTPRVCGRGKKSD